MVDVEAAPAAVSVGEADSGVVEGRAWLPIVSVVGIAPPLTIVDEAAAVVTGLGLGMLEASLYMEAFAGVVTLVVVFRYPITCISSAY